jgi:hypothetical protein
MPTQTRSRRSVSSRSASNAPLLKGKAKPLTARSGAATKPYLANQVGRTAVDLELGPLLAVLGDQNV